MNSTEFLKFHTLPKSFLKFRKTLYELEDRQGLRLSFQSTTPNFFPGDGVSILSLGIAFSLERIFDSCSIFQEFVARLSPINHGKTTMSLYLIHFQMI